MKMNFTLICFFQFILWSCAQAPVVSEVPSWIHQPARSVDSGYLVYVAKASSGSVDRAQFKAEGLALEDLANECSIIPKGTRIEDRYSEEIEKGIFYSYIKIGLEFQICESAKKSLQPKDIQELASQAFTEQLRKYQELIETGELPNVANLAEVTPPEQFAPPPERAATDDESSYVLATRQYVAYQKQIVVLSGPNAFAPNSLENQKFITAVSPSIQVISSSELKNPIFHTGSIVWSNFPNHSRIIRPPNLNGVSRHEMQRPEQRPEQRQRPPQALPSQNGGRFNSQNMAPRNQGPQHLNNLHRASPRQNGPSHSKPQAHGKRRKRKNQDFDN